MANDNQYLKEAIKNLTKVLIMANDHQHLMDLLLNTKLVAQSNLVDSTRA